VKATRIDFDSHHRTAQLEDVEFLVSTGLSYEDACRRVGVLPNTIERRDQRNRVSS
jgi:hypothetical protein